MSADFGAWLSQAITTHGYWVLALGSLLEGETVLLLAGFAAHRGYLSPWAVVAVASVCGFLGDQFFFWLGRRHGERVLAWRPAWAKQVGHVHDLIERWDGWLVVGVRFAYGLRIAGPVVMGSSDMPAWRFAFFNAIGALIWAVVVGAVGWFFGSAAQALLGEIHHLEGWLLLALVVVAAVIALVRAYRAK